MKTKSLSFWKAIGIIVMGVLFYLIDCFLAHKKHPEVSWIESGIYNWGPFGVLVSVVCVLTGLYYLVKGD
jgi:hypothetical protein